ncbi:MAG: HAD family hydrolase [Bacillota bacterium]
MIAVGDNFNDFEMLNFAGLSLVMDNADRRLKNMADIVVGNNNELGADRGLKNILKLN